MRLFNCLAVLFMVAACSKAPDTSSATDGSEPPVEEPVRPPPRGEPLPVIVASAADGTRFDRVLEVQLQLTDDSGAPWENSEAWTIAYTLNGDPHGDGVSTGVSPLSVAREYAVGASVLLSYYAFHNETSLETPVGESVYTVVVPEPETAVEPIVHYASEHHRITVELFNVYPNDDAEPLLRVQRAVEPCEDCQWTARWQSEPGRYYLRAYDDVDGDGHPSDGEDAVIEGPLVVNDGIVERVDLWLRVASPTRGVVRGRLRVYDSELLGLQGRVILEKVRNGQLVRPFGPVFVALGAVSDGMEYEIGNLRDNESNSYYRVAAIVDRGGADRWDSDMTFYSPTPVVVSASRRVHGGIDISLPDTNAVRGTVKLAEELRQARVDVFIVTASGWLVVSQAVADAPDADGAVRFVANNVHASGQLVAIAFVDRTEGDGNGCALEFESEPFVFGQVQDVVIEAPAEGENSAGGEISWDPAGRIEADVEVFPHDPTVGGFQNDLGGECSTRRASDTPFDWGVYELGAQGAQYWARSLVYYTLQYGGGRSQVLVAGPATVDPLTHKALGLDFAFGRGRIAGTFKIANSPNADIVIAGVSAQQNGRTIDGTFPPLWIGQLFRQPDGSAVGRFDLQGLGPGRYTVRSYVDSDLNGNPDSSSMVGQVDVADSSTPTNVDIRR